jgi:hypothetical protein
MVPTVGAHSHQWPDFRRIAFQASMAKIIKLTHYPALTHFDGGLRGSGGFFASRPSNSSDADLSSSASISRAFLMKACDCSESSLRGRFVRGFVVGNLASHRRGAALGRTREF